MAQVYSQNVVGYVNKSFQNGFFVLVSNPLKSGTNGLKEIMPNPPDNTQIWRWNVGLQDLDATIPTYSAGSGNWVPNAVLNPGEGFFVVAGANFTNTFVGEVLQGALSNPIVGGGNFQAVGSMVPVGGDLKNNVLKDYPALDNDQVWTWNVGLQDLNGTISTYSAGSSTWVPEANIPVADGFFLVRGGGPVNYVRNFTVN
jgi:hypothetical protein